VAWSTPTGMKCKQFGVRTRSVGAQCNLDVGTTQRNAAQYEDRVSALVVDTE
jgi:hypothetical protein